MQSNDLSCCVGIKVPRFFPIGRVFPFFWLQSNKPVGQRDVGIYFIMCYRKVEFIPSTIGFCYVLRVGNSEIKFLGWKPYVISPLLPRFLRLFPVRNVF